MKYLSVCSGIEAATCAKCKIEKPAQEFHRKGDGIQAWCKQCHNQYQRETRKRRETPEVRRWQNIKSRYGLTIDDVAAMKEAQCGCCAICGNGGKTLVIDHCHRTGKVRELLCHRCNVLIGGLDDPAIRGAVFAYLERHK